MSWKSSIESFLKCLKNQNMIKIEKNVYWSPNEIVIIVLRPAKFADLIQEKLFHCKFWQDSNKKHIFEPESWLEDLANFICPVFAKYNLVITRRRFGWFQILNTWSWCLRFEFSSHFLPSKNSRSLTIYSEFLIFIKWYF